jgi:hypothetical protein
MATLLKQLEVIFDTTFTDRIVENFLCKAFRALSNNDSTKKGQSWCDTLLLGQQLYKFKSNFILVLSQVARQKRWKVMQLSTDFHTVINY